MLAFICFDMMHCSKRMFKGRALKMWWDAHDSRTHRKPLGIPGSIDEYLSNSIHIHDYSTQRLFICMTTPFSRTIHVHEHISAMTIQLNSHYSSETLGWTTCQGTILRSGTAQME